MHFNKNADDTSPAGLGIRPWEPRYPVATDEHTNLGDLTETQAYFSLM